MRSILSLLFLLSLLPLYAQQRINGPMVGHVDLQEATIWLQCPSARSVSIAYGPLGSDSIVIAPAQVPEARTAHVLKFTLGPLKPGTTYAYEVLLDGAPISFPEPLRFTTQPLWKYRNDPPAFTVALGSCAYFNQEEHDRPGMAFGSGYGIFDAIADQRPDLMLWLGDNIYLREPDWGSRTGFLQRYTHMRSQPELQRLLRTAQHYAIWDDHDFGPNDADGSFINAPLALESFSLFWANPTTGAPGVPGAITAFSHLDADFFLLDDRTHRVNAGNETSTPALLGEAQIDWLIRALKYSDADFKFVAVGNQVLNTAQVFENYANYASERALLLDRIDKEGLEGVVFLTGDRHFSELSRLVLPGGKEVVEITSSPLTAGLNGRPEENALRVPGSRINAHNFALLRVEGPRKARTLSVEYRDTKGELIAERELLTRTRE